MGIHNKIAEKLGIASRRKKAAAVLAGCTAVAVLGTVAVFSGTGYTRTGAPQCGYADHEHTEECYLRELDCTFTPGADVDIVAHEHTRECFDQDGNLVCPLDEIPLHVHTDLCYQDPGSGHYAHTDECYSEEQVLACGLEEVEPHMHSTGCYDGDGNLICGIEETHVHDEDCYDSAGELACTKAENPAHMHDASCYRTERVLTCGLELDEAAPVVLHEHSPACYVQVRGELSCGIEESEGHVHALDCYSPVEDGNHVHTASCYKLSVADDHVHTAACYESAGEAHEHTDACYETVRGALECGKAETAGHVHTDACYSEAVEGHAHTADCYHDHDENCYETVRGELTCTDTSEGHAHGDSCYAEDRIWTCTYGESYNDHILICGKQEAPSQARELTCGKEAAEAHSHDDSCYAPEKNLICGKASTAHDHTEACYATVRGALTCHEQESVLHIHDDSCYATEKILACDKTLACGKDASGHVHDESCYVDVRGALECSEDHVHDDTCYGVDRVLACGSTLACAADAGEAHVHDGDCLVRVRGGLACGIPEAEGHVHGDTCYAGGELVCDIPESEGHVHGDSCYEMVDVYLCQNELTCGKVESEGHVHGDSCYESEAVLACCKKPGDVEAAPTCGKDEVVLHVHTANCMMVAANMHEHDEGCYVEGVDCPVCGKLAASDCPDAGDGLVYACGMPCVVEHVHGDGCFGGIPEGAEPICGRHVHDDSCYKKSASEDAGPVTCEYCGEEIAHVHSVDDPACGDRAEVPVLVCGKDHEHNLNTCYTEFPDCTIGGHTCNADGGALEAEPDVSVDVVGPSIDYGFVSEDGSFRVDASAPEAMFDRPVELRAERLEEGSDGWNRYVEAMGSEDASYDLVVDVWFVDAADGETVVPPDTSKGSVRVTATVLEDGEGTNSSSAVWGDAGSDGAPDAGFADVEYGTDLDGAVPEQSMPLDDVA